MKIGIMQPYFFPYIGYFSLIDYTDHFVFFDTPQYIQRGWVNRNRLINPKEGFNYMTVPIRKAPQETPINKIYIDNSKPWREKIYGQLTVYKKRAPYYDKVIELLHQILDEQYTLISKLNIESIKNVCNYMGIKTTFETFSEMDLDIDEVTAPDEWALNITQKLGYDTYVNPIGGMDFFDRNKYIKQNVKISFMQSNLKPYMQRIGRYEGGLSIIDVMMFNSRDEIKDLLKDFILI